MKEHIKRAADRASANPALQKGWQSIKPSRSIWGALGVIIFFILPEIIGFIWGKELAQWAHTCTLTEPLAIGRQMYWLLEKIFEEGGSWINLGIGVALLAWIFWPSKPSKEKSLENKEITEHWNGETDFSGWKKS